MNGALQNIRLLYLDTGEIFEAGEIGDIPGDHVATLALPVLDDAAHALGHAMAAAPALLAAAETVLAGLNARIDNADPSAVPIFAGIADLHDAIAAARGAA